MLRKTSKRVNLAGLNVEIVEGDMRDATAAARSMAGTRFCSISPLLPAWGPQTARDFGEQPGGNPAAHASSACGGGGACRLYEQRRDLACAANGGSADETMRVMDAPAIGAYKQSKVAAERVVETMIDRDHFPAVIVHPTAPIGPVTRNRRRQAGSSSWRPPAAFRVLPFRVFTNGFNNSSVNFAAV